VIGEPGTAGVTGSRGCGTSNLAIIARSSRSASLCRLETSITASLRLEHREAERIAVLLGVEHLAVEHAHGRAVEVQLRAAGLDDRVLFRGCGAGCIMSPGLEPFMDCDAAEMRIPPGFEPMTALMASIASWGWSARSASFRRGTARYVSWAVTWTGGAMRIPR